MAGNIDFPAFVVDASFVLAALFPDERSEKVDAVFARFQKGEINFYSTDLLPFEVLNSLRSAVVQKRLKSKQAETLTEAFLGLEIILEKVKEKEVFMLAVSKKLTVYDAGYLWLAREKKIPLLSLDKTLLKEPSSCQAAGL